MITANVRTCPQFYPTFCPILSEEKLIPQATAATPNSRRCRFRPFYKLHFHLQSPNQSSSINLPSTCISLTETTSAFNFNVPISYKSIPREGGFYGEIMTGKKRVSVVASRRHILPLVSKFVITLLVLCCFVVFFGLFSQFRLQSSSVSTEFGFDEFRLEDYRMKIAFLFLVRDNLPLDFLWHNFFKNADPENFTIYIHSKPGFVFDKSATRSAFFYNRQLKNSVEVGWGKPTMIEAEKLLFKSAFEDTNNQIFILLSDSCVPLYNFSYIYKYIMSSPRSYVDSFIDEDGTEKRYNPEMSPDIMIFYSCAKITIFFCG
ncbi:hypothetical protein LXL04_038144 [Taraxacum kok-saghyz]